jgi:hypothetical protein
MEIVFDTQTVREAGFDTYLIRAMFPSGTTTPVIETRFTDATNLVGGTIGSEGVIYLGSKQIRLDGKRGTMIWNDGTQDVVTLGKLSNGGFGIDVAEGQISGDAIVANSITSDQIAADTITADNIEAGTITATEIANATITNAKLVDSTIEAAKIKDSTITNAKLVDSTITGGKIADSTITGGKISVDNLAAISASLGNVTAGVLTVSGGASSYITIARGGSSGDNANLRFTGGNQIWTDSSDHLGMRAAGSIYFYRGSSPTLHMLISSGVTNIYTTNTYTRNLLPEGDNTYDLGSSSYRWDDVYATNGTIQTSDRRDKENIKNSNLGLEFIKKLIPKSFKWKKKTRTHYGFIAQDVEKILNGEDFAGFIKGENGKYGLRYTELIAPMVKAIQELSDKVDFLEKKLKEAENT